MASRHTVKEAIDAIIGVLSQRRSGAFTGKLSDQEGAKVRDFAGDRSMNRMWLKLEEKKFEKRAETG